MLYFAYGSNLSSERLIRRVPSAELVTTGKLTHHQLLFHKIGRDGSAKCDAFFTGDFEHFLHGAIYRIAPDHKKHLDQAEGLGNGYEVKTVTINTVACQEVQAFTYYATHITPGIQPFHWYKRHVLAGAMEHNFPKQYIREIVRVDSVKDVNDQRETDELSIHGHQHESSSYSHPL